MTERSSNDAARIRDNLARVREHIAAACAAAGRSPQEVTLLGVTKTVDPARVQALLDAGVTQIGENRVQEFLEKKPALRLDGITTHLIGHLQSNKVSKIVGEVDMIQSVDSERLARLIDRESEKKGIVTDLLIEVNIGRDDAKTGLDPDQLEPLLEAASTLPHIRVRGLMTVPPILDTEREKRKVFMNMRKLFIDIRDKKIDNIDMRILSMGMSGDFVEAILEGSTMVRVGSALFGARQY
ncbi:MAG: YggS family pyridoxal phosphate-dependent enzyme [Acutalibacteraceae bacterium]|jgi:pyridoxal phosphate enzyme (YggS family)